MIAIVAVVLLVAQSSVELGLSLADLPMYQAALEGRDDSPAIPVQFLDLWNRSREYRGRHVRIQGRVVRRFRAPASGKLPARMELWLATPDRNLICSVFPLDPTVPAEFTEGRRMVIEGTSLGLVNYVGGDVDRSAPLIVGCGPPVPMTKEREDSPERQGQALDWLIGGIAVAFVALFLARAHLRRPPPQTRFEIGPPLEFDDGA